MTSDLLFTSLLRAGSSNSRETVSTSWHPTYNLYHFCGPGRPVRETQGQLRDARHIIYITSASRVVQFAKDNAYFVTSDLLFTSLLRAGSSSSRKTVPTLWHPTYYLRHFCKAGRPVRETQGRLRDARPIIYITSGRQVAQFAGDSIHFVTPDLLFTPLRGGGLPTSRETAPTS